MYASFTVDTSWDGSIGGTQFSGVDGVAVDNSSGASAGDVYISDSSLVQKFDADGAFILSFDGSDSGTSFSSPKVAVDSSSGPSSGRVYVLDRGNLLVDIFNPDGTFISSFDGSNGSAPLSSPQAIAVDPSSGASSGDIYIIDSGSVYTFHPDGAFITSWNGSDGGTQFSNPVGIAVDSSGNVYVVDNDTNIVQKFSSDGVFIMSFADPGDPNDTFEGIAVDSLGNAYVTSDNQTVYVFNPSGNVLSKWEKSGVFEPGIAVNSEGVMYVSDQNNGVVYKVSHVLSVPVLSTFAPSSSTLSTAVLRGDITDGAPVSERGFVYGPTTTYGATTTETGSFFSVLFSAPIGGLSFGNLYHFRSYATNVSGTAYGADVVFRPFYKLTWGGSGSSMQGLFTQPSSLAVSKTTGNVSVLDTVGVIEKFDSNGALISNILTTIGGSNAIAIDSSDDIYITDSNQIKKFDSRGAFIREWGSTGSGSGTFNGVRGMAVDQSTGDIYVADQGNNLIQKFDSDGSFVSQWGGAGAGNGTFSLPRFVTVGSAGNVYVGDNNQLIQEFDPSGSFVRQWDGSLGGKKFNSIEGISSDSAGNIYVNSDNGLIQEFDSLGNFVMSWKESQYIAGNFGIDSSGSVYTIDQRDFVVDKFTFVQSPPDIITKTASSTSASTAAIVGSISGIPASDTVSARGFIYGTTTAYGATTTESGSFGLGDFNASLTGLAAGSVYHVKAFATDGVGTSYGIDRAFVTYSVSVFGGPGAGNGLFNPSFGPGGTAIDSQTGNIYVADTGNNLVQIFDRAGNFLRQMDGLTEGGTAFSFPNGIALDASGDLYVCDVGDAIIQKFDRDGHFLLSFGGIGSGNGLLSSPQGIAVNRLTGDVYVSDAGNQIIQRFGSNGNFISSFGGPGSGNGLFQFPFGLTLDSHGNVYVVDNGANLIEKFDSNGTFLTQWGFRGFGDTLFMGPQSVAVDLHDDVYVSDTSNGMIKKFDSSGNFIVSWIVPAPILTDTSVASNVAVDSLGDVYVSEGRSGRVFIYDLTYIPALTPPPSDDSSDTTPAPTVIAAPRTHSSSHSTPASFVSTTVVTTPVAPVTTVHVIPTKDLQFGFKGDDVKNLQKFLNSQGFLVSLTGPGAPGTETEFFGSLTKAALAKFQKAHGIAPAVGYFGPITRKAIMLLESR